MQEDINAQFGEAVAIRFYGASAEEQAELEKAAMEDEEKELHGTHGTLEEKAAATQQEVVTAAKA